jgi:hypothetical protein
VFELSNSGLPVVPAERKPATWSALEKIQEPGAIVALPYGYIPEHRDLAGVMQTNYMLWAQESGRRMMNGSSGLIPPPYHSIYLKLKDFPEGESLDTLKRYAGVRFILYHARYVRGFDSARFEEALKQHEAELTIRDRSGEGDYLIEFTPGT